MAWPVSQDFNEAIQSPSSAFVEPELNGGEAVANAMGLPMPRSGNFADVYEFVGDSGAKWALKCFTRSVPGLQERYSEISKHLVQAKLPFTVDFTYLEKGIRIRGEWYPLLKMPWVEGFLLNEFVRNNLDKPALLDGLGQIWLRMARRLNEANLAHADLQHGNVLLVAGSKASSLAVKLIDYDGMWVPALANKKSGEVGHPNFQHPLRLKQGTYSAEVDRLPLLAIACALRCLVVGGKSLWDRYDNGDNLLFREADLRNPAASVLFKELWQINDAAAHDLTGNLTIGLTGTLSQVPLVQDLVTTNGVMPLSVGQEKQVAELLGRGVIVNRPLAVATAPITKPAAPFPPLLNPSSPEWASLANGEQTPTPRKSKPKTTQGGKSAKRRLPLTWLVGGVLGLGVVALAILLFWPTPNGTVRIESDDPNVEIVFDKNGPIIKGADKEPISLRAGEHGLLIKRGDFSFEADKLILKKGQKITLKLEWLRGKVQVVQDGKVMSSQTIPPPLTYSNSIGMKFVLVPKGKSWLGGGGGKLGDKEVEITNDFYLGKHLVTQEEWQKVMESNPSHFSRTGPGKDAVKDISEADLKRFPVEMVSWDDAQKFLTELNKQEKEAGWMYRLPKEAEWEYACRGGPMADKSESAFDFYFDKPMAQLQPEQANFEHDKGEKRTCKVGSYKPNKLGLYDMHGNVWELCQEISVPKIPEGRTFRRIRGGGWSHDSTFARAAFLGEHPQSFRINYSGLRLARVPIGNEEAAWKPLFNGKDLTGWKTSPGSKGNWTVEKGILVGYCTGKYNYLFSDRDDYENYYLRVEAKIKGAQKGGVGAILSRSSFGPGQYPDGFMVNISNNDSKTGSLFVNFGQKWTCLSSVERSPHLPDEWFRMEITVNGDRIFTKVNDRVEVDFAFTPLRYSKGCIALGANLTSEAQNPDPNTFLEYRKVEIKELPGSNTAR